MRKYLEIPGACLPKLISCLSAAFISGLISGVPALAAEGERSPADPDAAGEGLFWALVPSGDNLLSVCICWSIAGIGVILAGWLFWHSRQVAKKISFIKKSLQEASGGDQSLYNRCEVTDKFLNAMDGNEQLKHTGRIFRNMLTRYPANGSWHYCNRGQAREVFNELTLGYVS